MRCVYLMNGCRKLQTFAWWAPNFFSLKPPSNEVGYIAPKDASDQPLLIEVLRWVNGVKEVELLADAVIFAIGQARVPVRVPSPVSLLKAKLANLHSINQRGRQDSKHVTILFRVIPIYLKDLIQSVGQGIRTERQVVNILGRLLDVVTAGTVVDVFEALKLDPRDLFDRLPSKDLPKVLAFKTHQLSRLLR